MKKPDSREMPELKFHLQYFIAININLTLHQKINLRHNLTLGIDDENQLYNKTVAEIAKEAFDFIVDQQEQQFKIDCKKIEKLKYIPYGQGKPGGEFDYNERGFEPK